MIFSINLSLLEGPCNDGLKGGVEISCAANVKGHV